MKFYRLFLIIALLSFSFGCTNKKQEVEIEEVEIIGEENNTTIHIVTTEFYKEILEQDSIQLVDVRTPKEYANGTLPGAVNMDFLDEKKFRKSLDKLNREEPIYIFCQSGNRSGKSQLILKEMGFKEIYDMKGGYSQWVLEQEK